MSKKSAKETWLFNEKGKFLVMENQKGKTVQNKVNPFTWLFKENPFYLAAFFLPAGILFLAYMWFGVYPRGENSVLALDLNAQYLYYYDYIHDVLRGKESLFYSWSRNLSGEFFGIIGYYLASPFNFLMWLFPREYITEGLLTMILAKVGAIGVCMAVYLKRGRGLSAGTALIFSLMYALCAYTVTQTMNPMWLDGVMALPLIIYGVESLVKYGRFRLLILSLTYSFITSFYIGYMLGIFTAVYFIFYLISSRASDGFDGGAAAARVGLFSISAATAILLSSFMLFPVYSSLRLGKFGFTELVQNAPPDFSMRTNFTLLDVGRKLAPYSYDTVRNEGLPLIYCGVLAVILLPLFFFAGKEMLVSVKKRVAGAVLILALLICMYVAPFDMFMHGRQAPNWLPYRYSFMLSFLLVAWSAEVYDKIGEYSRRAIGFSALAFFGLIAYFEGKDTFDLTLADPAAGTAGRELFDSVTVALPAILILTVLTVLLISNKAKKMNRKTLSVLVGIAVALELFHVTYVTLQKQDIDITYSTRESYTDFIVPLREKVDEIIAADDGFYRMEKTFRRTVNDPVAARMYGVSHSSSVLNEKSLTLLKTLGIGTGGHSSSYNDGATPLFDDLFGIKYVLSHRSPLYGYGEVLTTDAINVRRNENAMPIAYLTDKSVAGLYLAQSFDGGVFERQNRLLSNMLGVVPTDYFKIIEEPLKETENVTEGGAAGGYITYTKNRPESEAWVRYTMTAEADGDVYMWLNSDYERRLNVWVSRRDADGNIVESEWVGNYFEAEDYYIKNIGGFSEGESFTVTLGLERDDLYYTGAYFAYLDAELYASAIQELHAMNASTTVTRTSASGVRAEVFADTERLLFTTIPAEPGWKLTINGNSAEYVEVLDALIGVIVPAGSSTVELKFTPAGYPFALYFTGGGIALFILLCLLYSNLKKESSLLNEQLGEQPGDEDEQFTAEENFEPLFAPEPEPEPEPEDSPLLYEAPPSEREAIPEPQPEEDFLKDLIIAEEENVSSIISDFNEINAEPDVGDDDPVVPEPEHSPQPPSEREITPAPIDFAARKKALEMEMMRSRSLVEEPFHVDTGQPYEEEEYPFSELTVESEPSPLLSEAPPSEREATPEHDYVFEEIPPAPEEQEDFDLPPPPEYYAAEGYSNIPASSDSDFAPFEFFEQEDEEETAEQIAFVDEEEDEEDDEEETPQNYSRDDDFPSGSL